MDYLILLAFFGGGWMLSKFDSRTNIRKTVNREVRVATTKAFAAGCEHTLRMVQQHADPESSTYSNSVGFFKSSNSAKKE